MKENACVAVKMGKNFSCKLFAGHLNPANIKLC